jgi:hypothetical protein
MPVLSKAAVTSESIWLNVSIYWKFVTVYGMEQLGAESLPRAAQKYLAFRRVRESLP